MDIRIRQSVAELPTSATLEANQIAARRAREGSPVLHMGFGQSPFPVHPKLTAALIAAAAVNRYDNVAGLAELRESALAYFAPRLGFAASDYEVVVAPGSKLVLYAIQMAIDGDVIVPTPSWVSYGPHAGLLGDRVISVDAEPSDAGYRIDPQRLAEVIASARRAGRRPTKLILNSPNNPTGLVIPPSDHAALIRVCREYDVLIVSDELYSLVSFDDPPLSIAAAWPEGTAITTGLSKHLSLGGWRLGFGFVPKSPPQLFDAICAIASETWSCVSGPIQRAALLALSGDREIEQWVALCTRAHRAVARRTATLLRDAGIDCPMPQGAYYLWPNLERFRPQLAGRGINTSTQLARMLLDDHNLLTLPGTEFGAPPEQLALRLSVCDYDGTHALGACAGGRDIDAMVDDVAPRVLMAAAALINMTQRIQE